MSDPHDPPRWSHDDRAPRAVRDALRGARGYRPTAAQADAVARAVAQAVEAAPPPTPAAATAGSLKALFGVVGVGLCAAWLTLRPAAPPATPRATQVAARALPAPTAVDAVVVAPAPTAAVVADAAVAIAPATVAPRATPCTSAEHEARVQAAQRALREGPLPRALALANADRSRCPRGALAEERERVAIEALARAGRPAAAAQRWEQFQRAFPDSLYARRLRAVLGDGAAP